MRWIVGICAVAVLVAMIATVTVPAQTVTPDVATLKLFPPETSGLIFIDVGGLQAAPLFQQTVLQKMTPKMRSDLTDFSAATGIQIDRDVNRVTIGRIGSQQFLAVVQAHYDTSKVQQFIQNKGVESQTYLGRVIYSSHSGNPDMTNCIMLGDNLVIAGQLDAVKGAIDRMAATGPSIADNAGLMAQVRTIQAGSQIWAAGKFDENMFGHAKIPAQVGQIATSLTSGTYQMQIDQDLHLKASGNFATADMAKATADLANGLIAMAKLQFASQQDLIQLFSGLQIQSVGTSLNVSLDASGDVLKQFEAGKLGQHLQGK